MNAALPSQLLAAQHRQMDAGIRGIVDGSGNLAALAASLDLLRLHLYIEEAFLFPPLVKSGLAMPVFVMKREHGEMWPLLVALGEPAPAPSIEALHEPARRLLQLLDIHNPKEEQIVYTAADRLVAEHPDPALARALQSREVPRDWRCAMAPH